MAFKIEYMEMAIEEAKKGIGAVNPNPLVGAVIVKDNRVIAKGYHARYGDLHAERAAFAALKESAEGAEMYVTLEPCCHYGKQPPCVEAIVEHKISKVYVGSDDPNEKVSGKGYRYLREHGVEVKTHVLKEKCDSINEIFFHYITTKTPYVLMKYAMTMDGKIASYTGKSQWISNEKSRERVQELRNKYSGIMVGINTVLFDNPMLTCRIENGNNPVRIVCDTNLRIPTDCKLVETAKDVPLIVVTSDKFAAGNQNNNISENISENISGNISDKISLLKEKNVEIVFVRQKGEYIDIKETMRLLGAKGIDSILLEGGGALNYSCIEADVVNEVQVFVAPKMLGGKEAKTPVSGIGFENPDLASKFSLQSIEQIDEDVLITYRK